MAENQYEQQPNEEQIPEMYVESPLYEGKDKIEAVSDEPGPGDPAVKKLWEGLYGKKLYTKTYDEFVNQYNTPEQIDKLYNGLKQLNLYTKSIDEFKSQYFAPVESAPLEKKNQFDTGYGQSLDGQLPSGPKKKVVGKIVIPETKEEAEALVRANQPDDIMTLVLKYKGSEKKNKEALQSEFMVNADQESKKMNEFKNALKEKGVDLNQIDELYNDLGEIGADFLKNAKIINTTDDNLNNLQILSNAYQKDITRYKSLVAQFKPRAELSRMAEDKEQGIKDSNEFQGMFSNYVINNDLKTAWDISKFNDGINEMKSFLSNKLNKNGIVSESYIRAEKALDELINYKLYNKTSGDAKDYLAQLLDGKEMDIKDADVLTVLSTGASKQFDLLNDNLDKYDVLSIEKMIDKNDPVQVLMFNKYISGKTLDESLGKREEALPDGSSKKVYIGAGNPDQLEASALMFYDKTNPQIHDMVEGLGGFIDAAALNKIPNVVRGQLVEQFLNDPSVIAKAKTNSGLYTTYLSIKKDFAKRYPDYVEKVVAQKISQFLEDSGATNPIYYAPSQETVDEVVKKLKDSGKLTDDEIRIYQERIRPTVGTLKTIGKDILRLPFTAFVPENKIKTGGLLGSAVEGYSTGMENLAKGVTDLATLPTRAALEITSPDLMKDVRIKNYYNAVQKSWGTVNVNRTGINEVFSAGGYLGGNMVPLVFGGEVLVGVKGGELINVALNFEAANREKALLEFPNDPDKRFTYAALGLAGDMFLLKLLPTKAIGNKLKGIFNAEVKNVTTLLLDNKITQEQAKNMLLGVGKKAINFAGKNLKTASVLEAFNLYHKGVDRIFGLSKGDSGTENAIFEEIKNFKNTYLSSLFLTALSLPGKGQDQRGVNKVYWEMGINPESFRERIEQQAALNKDVAAQKNEMLSNLSAAERAVKEMEDKTLDLTIEQKQKYVATAMRRDAFLRKASETNDKTVKENYEEKAKEQSNIIKDILNNKDTAEEAKTFSTEEKIGEHMLEPGDIIKNEDGTFGKVVEVKEGSVVVSDIKDPSKSAEWNKENVEKSDEAEVLREERVKGGEIKGEDIIVEPKIEAEGEGAIGEEAGKPVSKTTGEPKEQGIKEGVPEGVEPTGKPMPEGEPAILERKNKLEEALKNEKNGVVVVDGKEMLDVAEAKKELGELNKKMAATEVKVAPVKKAPSARAAKVLERLGVKVEGEVAGKAAETKELAPQTHTVETIEKATVDVSHLKPEQKELATRAIEDSKKVVKAISKLVKKSVGKDLKIVFHPTAKTAERAVYDTMIKEGATESEATQASKDFVNKGWWSSKSGEIHVNLENAKEDTVPHEAFHPVLDFIASKSPEVINDYHSQLKGLKYGQEIANKAEKTYGKYGEDGKLTNETEVKKEAITDYVAKIASGEIKLDESSFQKVKSYILDLLNKMGIAPAKDITSIKDLQELAKEISAKFKGGEEIGFKEGETANSSQKVQFQSDFKHKESGIEWRYFKNSEDFKRLVDEGYVTFDKNIDDFGGSIVLHAPDAAFSGQILKDGKLVAEGKGGLYYPLVYHKNGDFWAATARGASSLAKTLNEARAKSKDGKIRMALVSSPIDKLMSSSLNGIGLLDILTSKAFSEKSGITQEQLRKAIIKGIKTTEKLKSENKDGMKPSQKPLPKITGNETLIELNDILKKFYPAENSDFAVRKSLNQNILDGISEYSTSKKVAAQLSNFLGEGSFNEKLKSTGGRISKANLTQGFSNILAEPTLRGEQSGKIYAIIELDADVTPVKTSEHESYPFSLRSVDANKKPVVHILKQRDFWYNHIADESGNLLKENKEKQSVVFPPSAGISSVVELKPTKVEGESEKVEQAKPQAPIVEFAVGYAPYRAKKVTTLEEDKAIRKSPEYKLYQNAVKKVADILGVKVENKTDTWGGYVDSETNKPIQEVSNIINVSGTKEQMRLMAATLGKIAPEMQDSILLGEYKSDADGVEHRISIGGFNNVETALKSMKDNGLEYFSLDKNTGELIILDLDSSLNKNIDNFIEQINKNGIKTEHTIQGVNAEFIESGSYDSILSSEGGKIGDKNRGTLNALIEEASKEYQKIKGSRTSFSKEKKEEKEGTLGGKPVTFVKLPENVEVVNGFYSPIEKRLAETKIEKQSPNKWIAVIGKGDEAKFTGVLGWLESLPPKQQVSKSEVQNWMKDNRIEINEIVVPKEKTTKERFEDSFQKLELPGDRSNYKEILITLPANKKVSFQKFAEEYYGDISDLTPSQLDLAKQQYEKALKGEFGRKAELAATEIKFKSSHYDEPNILAHIRMNTRVDAEGNKVLHIEEFQSDWGQKGEKEGFDLTKQQVDEKYNKAVAEEERIEDKINKKYGEDWQMRGEAIDILSKDDYAEYEKAITERAKWGSKFGKEYKTGTPEAPFVTKTSDWTKLAWKVALKEAVKEGADKITWTTGEQQNERYDLRKQVDEVNYYKTENGEYNITADKNGKSISSGIYKENELEEILGKEVAKKIIDNEGEIKDEYNSVFGYDEFGRNQKYKSLKGENLAVGGKGMLGFYGSPSENKLGIVGEVAKSLFKQEPSTSELKLEGEKASTQHSIDVTPEMKAQVESGLPQFSKEQADNLSDIKDMIREYVNAEYSLEDIKSQMKEEFGDYYKNVEPLIEQAYQELTTTGIKNKVVAKEREQRGAEEIEVEMKRSHGDVLKTAKSQIESGEIDASLLAAEVANKPRPLKAEESAALDIDRMRIKSQIDNLIERKEIAISNGDKLGAEIIQSKIDALFQDMDLNDKAARLSGYEAGLGLGIRRMMIRNDYSFTNQMSMFRAANGGKKVPKKYEEQLKNLTNGLNDALAKLGDVEAEQAIKNLQKEVNELSKNKVPQEETKAKVASIKDKILSKWKNITSKFQSKTLFSKEKISKEKEEQLKSISDDVNKMVKAYAESGVTDLDAIMGTIHKDLSQSLTGLDFSDIRDIVGGKYKAEKVKAKLSPEQIQAQANVQKVKTQIDLLRQKLELEDRSKGKRAMDYLHGWHRFSILSGIPSLGKIGAAALYRGAVTRAENIIGYGLSKIPGVSYIAKKAAREGSINAKAEAKAFTTWFDKMTMQDFKQVMKTGVSELDYLYGGKGQHAEKIPAWMEVFGRLHASMKLLPKRAEFFRSLEMRTEKAIRDGLDIYDPQTQEALATAAYGDASRAIFMQENPITDAYNSAVNYLEKKQPLTAHALRFMLPIIKVPSNYVAEESSYMIGGLKALYSLRKGLKNMTSEQADYFMRAIKKQSVGIAFIYLGYMNPNLFGGYYSGPRKKDDLEAGDIELFGVKIPHWLTHSPLLEMLQVGATMRRANDAAIKKGEKPSKITGIPTIFKGQLSQVPFFSTPERIVKSFESKNADGLLKWLYGTAESVTTPQLIQNIADWSDTKEGEKIKRTPDGFIEQLKSGIPGLRQTIPEDKAKYTDKEYETFIELTERGVEIPDINKRERYKVDTESGLMTQEQYDKFIPLVKEYQEKKYSEILKDKFVVKEGRAKDKITGAELSKEDLQNKINEIHKEAVEEAKYKLGLSSLSDRRVTKVKSREERREERIRQREKRRAEREQRGNQ